MLRGLGQSLERGTATMVLAVLGQADALLGMSCQGALTKCKVLMALLGHSGPSDAELQALCRQLQALREKAGLS